MDIWHSDILDVLELKTGMGPGEAKARHLQYSVMVPDMFMRRLLLGEAGGKWTLFCPTHETTAEYLEKSMTYHPEVYPQEEALAALVRGADSRFLSPDGFCVVWLHAESTAMGNSHRFYLAM